MHAVDKLWRIELFGGVQLARADGAIARFATRKVASLLAYLAYFSDRPHSREVLAEFLWPEAELEAQRNSFRVALNSLRKQLEPPGIVQGAVLLADRNTLRLNPESFSTDIQLFEAAVRQQNWEEAVGLYRAPLLWGWYDDWIDAERSRLADQLARALRQRTGQLWDAGQREAALAVARSAVQADPLDEENQRTLIRLFARAGRPEEAQAQYEALVVLLQEELGREPALLTRELLRRLPATEPLTELAPAPLAPSVSPPTVFVKPSGYIPTPLTRFFGRTEERASLVDMLVPGAARLVTLVGPGGVGKTRLALAAATQLREAYTGRVWFVSLVDVAASITLPRLFVTGLRLALPPDADPLVALQEYLSEAPTLLVCDNAEGHEPELGALLETLLTQCPAVTCLVTSRGALEQAGERVLTLAPLPTPSQQEQALEALAASPSVALLLDRAQAVRPDFQLTPRNAATIAQLCRRLDGWPLAIELIAAWAWSLTPAQMVERLEQRFELLVSEQRGIPERQRSLRVVLDAALELLDQNAQETLARLSVFRGGFTLAMAQSVAGDEALAALAILVRQALVSSQETTRGVRFRLLETVRDYAASLLSAADLAESRQAQVQAMLTLAVDARQQWEGQEGEEALAFFDEERENLVVALEYATPIMATNLLAATWPLWYARGFTKEGSLLLQRALEKAPDCAEAWLGLGRLHTAQGSLTDALAALMECEARLPEEDPRSRIVLFQRALIAQDLGDTTLACEALQRFALASSDDPWAAQWAQRERQRLLLESSTSLEGTEEGIGWVLLNLGFIAAAQGDRAAGRTLVEDALVQFRQGGELRGVQAASERLTRILAT